MDQIVEEVEVLTEEDDVLLGIAFHLTLVVKTKINLKWNSPRQTKQVTILLVINWWVA